MPDSFNPSVDTIPVQDYISKTVAIALLHELLEDEAIDEVVTNRIMEKFSQTLEDSSPGINQLPALSLMVISSIKSVKIIGPEGFQYKLGEGTQESLNLLEGESTFQLQIYPSKECPNPLDCPEASQPQIIIPRSGSGPTIDTILMQNSQDVMMMGNPIDGPPSPGGIDTPPAPSPGGIDTPRTPKP
ncbi:MULTISPECIES: hypothetical protein [Oscillatoria]|uniref:Uncharacterized protein n=1 Tax=Oscillatoria acuminata PCC 6304 TaxID=56110 RepID=K9TFF3_9CYAN|nr:MULTISPECIES: hypothetical protein [Oscillatoria]AFY80851.1 hypothetical protein Oscil6304_1125 [Oscillatoria acuminata PCC 6304]